MNYCPPHNFGRKMQLRHLTIRLFVCHSLAATGLSSVIFPGNYLHWGNKDRSRIRTPPKRVNCGARDTSRRGACGVERRAELSQQLAFTPLHAALGISTAAALGYIGQKLQSESVRRALYFWYHAGPVVLHYKFTRWYLAWTRAPLGKRDLVYNSLHDRYCQRCLDIALHLKGLYIKVRSRSKPNAPFCVSFTLAFAGHASRLVCYKDCPNSF